MKPTQSQTCVVLAGGLGTRLRQAVADVPKCLAPVGSRPFLEIQIGELLNSGVNDIVLALGHMSDQVVDAVARMKYRDRVRHVVEPSLLGTGGAIASALDALGLDEVLVANGDTHIQGDTSPMLQPLDREGGELLRMAVVRVSDSGRFGGVQLDVQQRVYGFLEKGKTGPGYINAGLYRLCRATLPALTDGPYSMETLVLPDLVERGAISARAIDGSFIDIGVPEDYFRFCAQYER